MNKKVLFISIYVVILILLSVGFGFIGFFTNNKVYYVPNNNTKDYVEVLYAKRTITAGSLIKEEDIGVKKVPASLANNAMTDKSDLINYRVSYCVKEDMKIAINSLFYLDDIRVCDVDLLSVKNNLLYLDVSNIEEFNKYKYIDMYDYVDLNVEIKDINGDVVKDKFIENAKIISIYDANKKNIFKSSKENDAEVLVLDVNDEIYKLVSVAKYLNATITPVLKINSVARGEQIVSDKIKSIIENKSL